MASAILNNASAILKQSVIGRPRAQGQQAGSEKETAATSFYYMLFGCKLSRTSPKIKALERSLKANKKDPVWTRTF